MTSQLSHNRPSLNDLRSSALMLSLALLMAFPTLAVAKKTPTVTEKADLTKCNVEIASPVDLGAGQKN
jgi:hypothetical protein